MNEEDFISIPARVALLQKLGQPVADLPTDEAERALKILAKFARQSTTKCSCTSWVIKNPVTRTQGSMIPTSDQGYIIFEDLDTKFDRTKNLK